MRGSNEDRTNRVERTGGSRLAQTPIQRQRRLALVADLCVRRIRPASTYRYDRVSVIGSHEKEARRQSTSGALGEARSTRGNCVYVDRAFSRHRRHWHSSGDASPGVEPSQTEGAIRRMLEQPKAA